MNITPSSPPEQRNRAAERCYIAARAIIIIIFHETVQQQKNSWILREDELWRKLWTRSKWKTSCGTIQCTMHHKPHTQHLHQNMLVYQYSLGYRTQYDVAAVVVLVRWIRLTKARYTLATKLHSTRSTLLKVDCCRNRQQIGNKVDCCRYGRLCCRFWEQIGNNLNSTACRGRLCCRCVRGQSDKVDFVDFQQSQPCWIQLVASVYGALMARFSITAVLFSPLRTFVLHLHLHLFSKFHGNISNLFSEIRLLS